MSPRIEAPQRHAQRLRARLWLSRIAPGLIALSLIACGGAAPIAKPAAPEHDRPVAASEPRAELQLELELHPSHDCEERFDLALYANRGVHRIAWNEARNPCRERRAQIVYLSKLLREKQLLELVRKLARSARVLKAEAPAMAATEAATEEGNE
jgi:hypothetical protein